MEYKEKQKRKLIKIHFCVKQFKSLLCLFIELKTQNKEIKYLINNEYIKSK